MTDNNVKGESIQNTGSGSRININASMTQIVDKEQEKGKQVTGKADLSIESMENYVDGSSLVIPVGDCVRDGVMPSKEQMEILSTRRRQRDRLKPRQNGLEH